MKNEMDERDFRNSYMETHVRHGIAYQIQAIRESFGLTQEQLGEVLNKSQGAIARLEDIDYGRLSVTTLLEVAKGLDIALLVRFVSFPEFLTRTHDVSPKALRVPTYEQSKRLAMPGHVYRFSPAGTAGGVKNRVAGASTSQLVKVNAGDSPTWQTSAQGTQQTEFQPIQLGATTQISAQ